MEDGDGMKELESRGRQSSDWEMPFKLEMKSNILASFFLSSSNLPVILLVEPARGQRSLGGEPSVVLNKAGNESKSRQLCVLHRHFNNDFCISGAEAQVDQELYQLMGSSDVWRKEYIYAYIGIDGVILSVITFMGKISTTLYTFLLLLCLFPLEAIYLL